MSVGVIILAAGRGKRAAPKSGDDAPPKQYGELGGMSVLKRVVLAFMGHSEIDRVQLVYDPADAEHYEAALEGLDLPVPVPGGTSRQGSVLQGLKALALTTPPEIVLIHDAARAFVSDAIISAVIARVRETNEGAIPALAVSDTLKRGKAGVIEETLSRDGLYRAQTPQGFPYPLILAAHEKSADHALTDDAAVAEAAGLKVHLVPGDEENIKLTTAQDFTRAQRMFMRDTTTRTGMGYDVHRFQAGDHLWLAGVKIPHGFGLKGHSDADAGLHAITDALLGAIGAGDIGDHFPPSDAQWENASSDIFLKHAAGLVAEAGGKIENIDLTIICETPKIAPHRAAMKARVAEILAISQERVSIKATTTEQLGFTGRREGIAAQAVATVTMCGDER